MLCLVKLLSVPVTIFFRSRRDLLLENLALRQQLAVLKRRRSHPRLAVTDRLFWDVLQLLGWLAGDVKESRNGNPTRDLQMAADPNPASSLYGVRGIRYSLSLRDVEELLAERGLKVDHTTVSG